MNTLSLLVVRQLLLAYNRSYIPFGAPEKVPVSVGHHDGALLRAHFGRQLFGVRHPLAFGVGPLYDLTVSVNTEDLGDLHVVRRPSFDDHRDGLHHTFVVLAVTSACGP